MNDNDLAEAYGKQSCIIRKLQCRLDAAEAALGAVEWSEYTYDGFDDVDRFECPECNNTKEEEHAKGCKIGAWRKLKANCQE